jgi:glutamate-1-semialdehyde aminotransferase
MTGVERVCFCNSGTEAVMTALRLARAATGRNRVAMFKWSYHGHFDATLGRPKKSSGCDDTIPAVPGVAPRFVADLVMLDYGDPASFAVLDRYAGDLAAVLVEPVQSLNPEIQPRDFLHDLRRWTEAHGVALIFDDILLGFRIHPAGSQKYFGVTADIVTYGKIIGGGFPIGVVGGGATFMDGIDGGVWHFGDDSAPKRKRTYFAGTFNKNPITMAASAAVLEDLRQQGEALQEGLNHRTARLARQLNDYFQSNQFPLRVVYFGSMFRFRGPPGLDLLSYELLARGVYVWEGGSCFLSSAHSDADIEFVVDAVERAAQHLWDAELLGC